MPGKIKSMITQLLREKAKGDPVIENSVKVKLILKGINPDKFSDGSPDDPEVINKIKALAQEYQVRLT